MIMLAAPSIKRVEASIVHERYWDSFRNLGVSKKRDMASGFMNLDNTPKKEL